MNAKAIVESKLDTPQGKHAHQSVRVLPFELTRWRRHS